MCLTYDELPGNVAAIEAPPQSDDRSENYVAKPVPCCLDDHP